MYEPMATRIYSTMTGKEIFEISLMDEIYRKYLMLEIEKAKIKNAFR